MYFEAAPAGVLPKLHGMRMADCVQEFLARGGTGEDRFTVAQLKQWLAEKQMEQAGRISC